MTGGGGSKDIQQTTTANLTPQQQQLMDLGMPFAQKAAANPVTLPDWSAVAGFNPTQLAGQSQVLGGTGVQSGVVGSAADASQRATSGSFMDPNSNPALQKTIAAAQLPIYQNFTDTIMPAIRRDAVGAGQPGGSREGIAEGLAARGTQQAAEKAGADISTAGYQSGLDALLKSMGLAPQTAAAQSIPGATTSSVGDVQQAQTQAELNEKLQKYLFPQEQNLSLAQALLGMSAGLPGGSTTTTGNVSSSTSDMNRALGGAATGASLGSVFGPWGTVIGGVGGAGLGYLNK